MIKLNPADRSVLAALADGAKTPEQIACGMKYVNMETWREWLPPMLSRLETCGYVKRNEMRGEFYLP